MKRETFTRRIWDGVESVLGTRTVLTGYEGFTFYAYREESSGFWTLYEASSGFQIPWHDTSPIPKTKRAAIENAENVLRERTLNQRRRETDPSYFGRYVP